MCLTISYPKFTVWAPRVGYASNSYFLPRLYASRFVASTDISQHGDRIVYQRFTWGGCRGSRRRCHGGYPFRGRLDRSTTMGSEPGFDGTRHRIPSHPRYLRHETCRGMINYCSFIRPAMTRLLHFFRRHWVGWFDSHWCILWIFMGSLWTLQAGRVPVALNGPRISNNILIGGQDFMKNTRPTWTTQWIIAWWCFARVGCVLWTVFRWSRTRYSRVQPGPGGAWILFLHPRCCT